MVWVAAQLRGERMVAHDFANTSFWVPVWTSCRSFFQGNALLIHILLGPSVAPADRIQMKPRFMMTTLIIRSQAECFPRDGACTMLIQFPKALRTRWFEKSADVCPHVRNGSTSPQWWVARWPRQGTVREGFVNSILVVFAAVPPCSTIEITFNQVNFLRNHYGTKSKNELLGDAFLLGVNVADM